MKISVVCTCNKFWNRFNTSQFFWSIAHSRKPDGLDVDYIAGTIDESIPTQENLFAISQINPRFALKSERSCESKPAMLKYLITRIKSDTTHVLLTDADILVPPDLFQEILSANADKPIAYAVSDRIDLDLFETNMIMSAKHVDEYIFEKEPNITKRGMGWFQLIDMKLFASVIPLLNWETPGYDKFDWRLNQSICALVEGERTVLEFSKHILHLYHGDPGSTWQGCSFDY